ISTPKARARRTFARMVSFLIAPASTVRLIVRMPQGASGRPHAQAALTSCGRSHRRPCPRSLKSAFLPADKSGCAESRRGRNPMKPTNEHGVDIQRRSDHAPSEQPANEQQLGRRAFLKGAVVGGAAAAAGAATSDVVQAQQPAAAPPPAAAGYAFLNLDEAAFVEALVDHMVPADDLSPKGTDIGINIYIDRALAGAWGKGDRLYMQGPWKI